MILVRKEAAESVAEEMLHDVPEATFRGALDSFEQFKTTVQELEARQKKE